MEEVTPNRVFLKQQSLLLLLWVPENRQALPITQGLYKKKAIGIYRHEMLPYVQRYTGGYFKSWNCLG